MLNHFRPFPFRPKSGVYLIFQPKCWPLRPLPYISIFAPTTLSKADGGLQDVDLIACRDIYCEETSPFKYLKFFSQNAVPLWPLPFRLKSGVYLIFLQYISAPTPLLKAEWGSDVHLMACRDICCEETSLFKYLKFFSQNAEPLRPLQFRPKSGVFLNFLQNFPLYPFQRQMGVRIHLIAL